MITPARKSFALSLAFHALMGSMAFWVLTQMNHPIPVTRIPFKIMSFQPTEHRIAVQLPQPVAPTEQQPLSKSTPTQQPIPKPTPVAAPTTPVVQTATPIIAAAPKAITSPSQPVTAAPIAAPKPEPKPDTSSEKRHFLASLRTTIQNNLHYPPAARRRGMEGEVGIRFTLNSSGSISSINILSGEGIFHNAAKAAVSSASGISVPKNLVDTLPIEIDLTLDFELKNG